MKISVFLAVLVLMLAQAARAQQPDEDSFRRYVQQYHEPQFFDDNDQAFLARLKLLDHAPAGSVAKILTFVFDNGEVVRRLSTHVCQAARRGVKVQLIADSKSGGLPGWDEAFDTSVHNRVNEDNYQYMANCGAEVLIHNSLHKFNSFLGRRIPRVTYFDNLPVVLWGLQSLASDFVEILKEEIESEQFREEGRRRFREAGLSREMLREMRSEFARLLVAGLILRRGDRERTFFEEMEAQVAQWFIDDPVIDTLLREPEGAGIVFDESLAALHEKLARINFEAVDLGDIAYLHESLKKRFASRPDLVEFYENVRRFNRLNHRKLFLVESPAGEGCFVLGGRNLGDHYLASHDDSFMDGDVLYCRHHGQAEKDLLTEAKSSFDELRNVGEDAVLEREKDVSISSVQPVPLYPYKELIVPPELRDPLSVMRPPRVDFTELSREDRTLLPPLLWLDDQAITGWPIAGATNWRIHRVTWQPERENDSVRRALIHAISNETQDAYIETAYAEFDGELREAVEQALNRGVNVRLVTNGLLISDGPSKMIRIFMGLWLRDMQHKYDGSDPALGRFDVRFASLEGGHMIHFKGAGFRCQRGQIPYRTSIIGSHNFHPRSGYSDKEHAIQWNQPAGADCMREHGLSGGQDVIDLVAYRDAFYHKMQARFGGRLLMHYPTLLSEIEHARKIKDRIPERRYKRINALGRILYRQSGQLRGGKATEYFLMFLRESGMRDFLGIVL